VGAERNDGGDAEGVLDCKLSRILETTQIKTLPNSRYHSLPTSLFEDSLRTPTHAERNSLSLA